jgi:hypothetical protein
MAILELVQTVLKGQDFSGADKTEGGRNEQNDEPRYIRVGCTGFDVWVDVIAKGYVCRKA